MAKRKSNRKKWLTSAEEVRARRACEPVCKVHYKRMEKAFEDGKPQKIVEFHSGRYWRCVGSCFASKLPKKAHRAPYNRGYK